MKENKLEQVFKEANEATTKRFNNMKGLFKYLKDNNLFPKGFKS